jgi:peptidoglycan LD-endopeptidase LytH
MRIKILAFLFGLAALAGLAVGGFYLSRRMRTAPRDTRVDEWIRHPDAHPDWATPAGSQCAAAPFQFPTRGFIGYLWDDSFNFGQRHTGIDIFGGAAPGIVPITAAYPGFITRLPDWKSSLIVRIPSDPLHPGRQIWAYYTHMADPQGNSLIDAAFPPGTSEVPIQAGTLLGRMGNFSGAPGSPVGVHLHFSILQSDAQGRFTNETNIANTLDPSPYFGLPLNANRPTQEIARCP